jgi:hypothetical protein
MITGQAEKIFFTGWNNLLPVIRMSHSHFIQFIFWLLDAMPPVLPANRCRCLLHGDNL